MLAIHIIALIVCVPAFVLGGWYGNVCRYSSDGPTCRTDLDCNDPEVHCYKPYGFTRGKCCVKRKQYVTISAVNFDTNNTSTVRCNNGIGLAIWRFHKAIRISSPTTKPFVWIMPAPMDPVDMMIPRDSHRVLSGASPPFLGFSVAGIITVALHGKDQQRFLESAALTDAYLVKIEELTRQRKQYVQLEFTEYNSVIELKW